MAARTKTTGEKAHERKETKPAGHVPEQRAEGQDPADHLPGKRCKTSEVAGEWF
jgi:hypothetical protein